MLIFTNFPHSDKKSGIILSHSRILCKWGIVEKNERLLHFFTILGYSTASICDILAKIDTDEAYKGVLSLYDYSILTLSHYTDDSAAGVKLSIILEMPNPVNLCTLDDNFNDEPYEEPEDTEIDINDNEVGDIDLTPISLPKSGC